MRPEKWYQKHLAKYFTEQYGQYEDTAEFWTNPAPNQWLFRIPELGVKVRLTCNDRGVVEERRTNV